MSNPSSATPWVASIPIVASDRNASKKWYVDKLGLKLVDDDDHWVTVGGDGRGSVLHLCQASENRPHPIPLEPGRSGLVIVIPGEFEAECRRLKEKGVEFYHEPEKASWGWWAGVRDPDGNEHYLSPASD